MDANLDYFYAAGVIIGGALLAYLAWRLFLVMLKQAANAIRK